MNNQIKWTNSMLVEKAKEYTSRSSVKKDAQYVYHQIRLRGIEQEAYNHMNTAKRRSGFQKEEVLKIALEFKTRNEFKKGDASAYNFARKKNFLEEACAHMENSFENWDYEKIYEAAKDYKYKSSKNFKSFRYENYQAYQAAKHYGILDDVCAHMIDLNHDWTFEEVQKIAQKYESRNEFNKGDNNAYQAATRLGIMDKVCEHMSNKYIDWREQEIAAEALKYNQKKRFEEGSPLAYSAALRHGLMDKVCGHMLSKYTEWTAKMIESEAKKYDQKTRFKEGSPRAYAAARKRKLLDDISSHMKKGEKGFDTNKPGLLYYISINNGMAYKIGITNLSVEQRFRSDINKVSIIKIWEYIDGKEALAMEQKILTEFEYARWDGPNLLYNGNTEIFKYDVLGLDN